MPRGRLALLLGPGLLVGGAIGNVVGVVGARRTARRLRLPHELDGLVPPPGPAVDTTPLRLLTLGDSAMAGDGIQDPDLTLPRQVASRLAEATGRPVHVEQRAVSGHTTVDVAGQLVPAPQPAPDVVVVSAGVNDGLKRRPLRTIRRDTVAMVHTIRDVAPDARIVLVGAPDLRHAPALPQPLRRLVGFLTGRVGRAQASWLATHGVDVVEIGTPASDFGPDGFHPGPTATPMIAGWIVDRLA
ncbi:SGNH/GDSL hydrolase family protein [Euzebya rosea]|uniref:SGNH/GDSL hydrolase family protein n=1 Tax=Euzebya rosea TaxID=2052804 RepID=UPI000D3E273B|nr:SGNH/GDSL hydrolase family protein [Euzebya rosea]